MDLNEAIILARKCLHYNPERLERDGVTELQRYDAYNIIAEYHSRINLLYQNTGTTEVVLEALNTVKER